MKRYLTFALLSALVSAKHISAHPAAEDMMAAANRFIASLTDEQKPKALFDFNCDDRQGWFFVPDKFTPKKMRIGLGFKDMSPVQKILAHTLLSSALSSKGYLQATQIMVLEQVLHEMEKKNPIRDVDLYYVSIFGTPSPDKTWGWRFEGHHLSLSFTLVNGHLFSVTPSFYGSNPGQVPAGDFAGMQVLKEEEELGRSLAKTLTGDQKKKAVIAEKAPRDIITKQDRKADKGLFSPPKGIPFGELNATQQKQLLQLVGIYKNKHRAEVVDQIDQRIDSTSGKDMYFAWAGSTKPREGHYYRIQTPKFLFEYDNTQNGANHIHAVWREFDGDFGEDLLRKHYEKAHK